MNIQAKGSFANLGIGLSLPRKSKHTRGEGGGGLRRSPGSRTPHKQVEGTGGLWVNAAAAAAPPLEAGGGSNLLCSPPQMCSAIEEASHASHSLQERYQQEVLLCKKYHDQLLELKGELSGRVPACPAAESQVQPPRLPPSHVSGLTFSLEEGDGKDHRDPDTLIVPV